MSDPEYYFYNLKATPPKPFGLFNTGAICWFNSLLQVIISLSSFNEWMLKHFDEFGNNNLATRYLKAIEEIKKGTYLPNSMSTLSRQLIRGFMIEAHRAEATIDLKGQEGATNGLCVFLDVLGHPDVYRLFKNKYEMSIKCPSCNERVSVQEDTSPLIEMYCRPLRTQEEYQNFIRVHFERTNDYTCEKCNTTHAEVNRLAKLQRLREVIILVFGPNNNHQDKWYPQKLHFPSTDNKVLRYKLVGQVHHSGSLNMRTYQSGGHYTSEALRPDGVYNFNDQSVTPGNLECKPSAHVLFYHLVEHSDLKPNENFRIAVNDANTTSK